MASEQDFWGRDFTPGPIKVDSDATAMRAKVVRDALASLAKEAEDAGMYGTAKAFKFLSRITGDDTLAKLGRMLR